MQKTSSEQGTVLITGGTSGLGLELVKLFLELDYYVVATGRQEVSFLRSEGKFRFYRVDFSNLKETAAVMELICNNHDLDYVIFNAGILSPPDFTLTSDGNEYTFQVNFLAHFLINEIITRKKSPGKSLKIAAITSPVYRIAGRGLKLINDRSEYNPIKAYSDSKLFLLLMCRRSAEDLWKTGVSYLIFDPGIFGSRIYRMQSKFFGIIYRIAAPFMRKPSSVAMALAGILIGYAFVSGEVYDRRKRIRKIPGIEHEAKEEFRNETQKRISAFIQQQ